MDDGPGPDGWRYQHSDAVPQRQFREQPGSLYVSLEDSSGKVGVATHPDSRCGATAAWTRWEIPVGKFGEAGVNLTCIKTLHIGVGERPNPAPGGPGMLYIDNIYVGGPGGILPVARRVKNRANSLVAVAGRV